MNLHKGYIKTHNKKSVEKFKNCTNLKTREQVIRLKEFAGILAEDTILIDVDDFEQSELLFELVQSLQLKCRVYKTTRGKHFLFKNKDVDSNRTGAMMAIGLTADIKLGKKNSYQVLRFDGKDREILYDTDEAKDLPKWLKPVKTNAVLRDMEAGDGRNQALFNYILTLQSADFSTEEARECIKLINKYILKDPLPESELDVILRDEAFPDKNNCFPHMISGKPVKHWENTKWLCMREGINFRYNELTKKTESGYDIYRNLSADSVITDLRGKCALRGYTLSQKDTADHILRIAEENAYNPVCDYLLTCKENWDGQRRTRDFFKVFTLDPISDQDPDFMYMLFEKWLITCTLLPFNKGTESAQGVLVLVGNQGIGKTRMIYKLLPNPEWGKTGMMIDLRNKDTVIQALGYWIVELGEYGRSLTAEKTDHYKAFATESKDRFRVPYGRDSEEHPRTTVFYATTDTNRFLKDDAGERRNWVIAVSGFNDIVIDIDQLWGEVAYMALDEHKPHWLTREEIEQINKQNEAYKDRSAEYLLLVDSFHWEADKQHWWHLNPSELCEIFNLHANRTSQMGKALKMLIGRGIEPPKNHRSNTYFCPPFTDGLKNHAVIEFHPEYRKNWNGFHVVGGKER